MTDEPKAAIHCLIPGGIKALARLDYAVVPREPFPDILGAGLAAMERRLAMSGGRLTHGEALETAYRAMVEQAALKEPKR